jgi:glycine C-acetyltransferase
MTGLRAPADETCREIIRIVAAGTSYDESFLLPDSHLEGELGIDSIVLEPILAEVRNRFGLAGALPSDLLTVRDIADAVDAAGGRPEPEPEPAAPVANGAAADDLGAAVLAATMRHTHYQRHQLDLDADIEGELGIDSVVLTAIVREVARDRGLDEHQPEALGATTLRTLIDALAGRPAGPAARPVTAPRATAPAPPAPPTVRPTVRPTPEPTVPAVAEQPWDQRSMKDFMELRDPDLFAKARDFGTYLRRRQSDELYWYGMPLQSRCANRAVIHDELSGRTREYLMFASNNYLGLANHPKVIEAICDATRVYGATNTGCRLIGGTNVLHKELERRLAAFKGREAAIVYPGGYSANLGTISALARSYDAVVVDKLNHMSIVDGCKLSGAVRKIYRHNDMADLERVLDRCGDQVLGKLIAVDGVFSMHGDIAALPDIVQLARRYGARVLVDDAHATGVLGARGTGTAEHFGLKGEVDLELGTMSKTLAGMGGFVVGDAEVIEYLRFYADSYVFAATIPAGMAAGLIAAIDVIEDEPERITRLWANIRRLRAHLLEAGFDLERSDSAIVPILIGDERRAMEMGRAVRARGLFCQTVVFPGVPVGDARLRISVTSEHTDEDIDTAAGIFLDSARETGVLQGRS